MRGDEGRDRETRNAYAFVVRTTNFALRKMQATGSKSNQSSGSVDALVFEVLAALSPNETRWRLERLAKKLAALRASDAPPRIIKSRRRRPRRPGWVLDAVCRVLADQTPAPMRPVAVHAAVEASIGEKISKDSVSWVLSFHSVGPSPLFVRVARGRYALVSAV
jgi:hypothetical protein